MDISSQLRTTVTRLTDQQLKEAEAAFALLGTDPISGLVEHVQHSLSHHARMRTSLLASAAIDGYLDAKRKEHERGALSIAALWTIERAMRCLRASLGEVAGEDPTMVS